MIVKHSKKIVLVFLIAVIAMLLGASGAWAATPPIKEIVTSHFGREVNLTEVTAKGGPGLEDICTVESKDECQLGKPGSEPGEFKDPNGMAGAPNGNVYVAEDSNYRVQELNAKGEFVLMFGKDVNETTAGDVCTEEEVKTKGVKCKAGLPGTEAGALSDPRDVALDPVSGNVYVAEPQAARVDEYTASGQFVLMIGTEVNQTTKANLCTETEVEKGAKCQAGVFTGFGVIEHGAFVLPLVVAVGPANGLLYVGDEHRVQEFNKEGAWVAEIREPLEKVSSGRFSRVVQLAVDQAGDVYLVYEAGEPGTIREFDSTGTQINEFSPGGYIDGIALDPTDESRLAVIEDVEGVGFRGRLYEVEGAKKNLRLITEFPVEHKEDRVTFNGDGELYADNSSSAEEIVAYKPVPVGEFLVSAGECVPGAEHETDVTLNCSLKGEVDPWGVKETQVWFQWGRTQSLGEKTEPPVPVASVKSEGEEETPVKVSAPIDGVRPNETFYDRVAGEDRYVKTPELLTSATESFTTRSVPPRIVGELSAAFLKPTSAVLYSTLNPENATTHYEFQYAPAETCPDLEGQCSGLAETNILEASEYGTIGVALEAIGLRPATIYRYRLLAVNEVNGKHQTGVNETGGQDLPEAQFETAPSPVVLAETGGVSTITTTGAIVSGTVNPDGQSSAYTFEMGVYDGAGTQYATVFSGSAGAGIQPVQEQLQLTGLQPGTTYAYRIGAHFGDGSTAGSSATGATQTFTTTGLSAVLFSPASLGMLSIPSIAFPVETKVTTTVKKTTPKCAKGRKLSHGGCAKAKTKKAKRAKKSSGRRK